MTDFYDTVALLSPRFPDLGVCFFSGCGAYSFVFHNFFLMNSKHLPHIFRCTPEFFVCLQSFIVLFIFAISIFDYLMPGIREDSYRNFQKD